MQNLNEPIYIRDGNVFVLYKANFEMDPNSTSMVAGGNSLEVGRYSTEEELQRESIRLFKKKARKGN